MGAGRAQPRWAAVGAAPFASARAEAGGEGVKRGWGGRCHGEGSSLGRRRPQLDSSVLTVKHTHKNKHRRPCGFTAPCHAHLCCASPGRQLMVLPDPQPPHGQRLCGHAKWLLPSPQLLLDVPSPFAVTLFTCFSSSCVLKTDGSAYPRLQTSLSFPFFPSPL